MTQTLATYPNVPLLMDKPSIRILKLERESSGSLSGKLEVFHIEDAPAYMALSYMWGDEARPKSMKLNGNSFPIGQNLFEAMHGIFDHMEKANPNDQVGNHNGRCRKVDFMTKDGQPFRYVWIDALCINQSIIAERNHQVNLMNQIYSSAEVVVAWLGQDDEAAEYTMRLFRTVRSSKRVALRFRILKWPASLVRRGIRSLVPMLRKRNQEQVRDFLNREYFRRVWILQELTLAQNAILLCGNNAIAVDDVWDAMSVIGGLLEFYAAGTILSLKYLSRDLGLLIHKTLNSECKDPRDKVYGLLGIATASISNPLRVFYFRGSARRKSKERKTQRIPHHIMPDYAMSPLELLLVCIGAKLSFIYGDIPLLIQKLSVPPDLQIPLDEYRPGLHDERFKPEFVGPMEPYLTKQTLQDAKLPVPVNFGSRMFLRYVRSLDWSDMLHWADKHEKLKKYHRLVPDQQSMSLTDLLNLKRRWQWVAATLETRDGS